VPVLTLSLLAAALASALSAGGAWFWQANAYTARIAAMEKAQAEQTAIAVTKALDDTVKLQRKKDAALKAAETRAAALHAAAAGAAAESDSLRAQLAEARMRLPDATLAACREYAISLSTVLDQCQARHRELAGKADGHAADVRTLLESWPRQ
jgi:hypothetical protein